MKETYVSIDIETDGPAPGINSMLSLGAAAFTENKVELWYGTFTQLPEASPNPETMKWWDTQPAAYKEVTANPGDPSQLIPDFVKWVKDLPGKKIAVAWPAAFDFAFVNYYTHRFAGENPLGFACLDIRSFANGLAHYNSYYGLPERIIKGMAGKVDNTGLRPHVALDDAIEQGRLFMQLREFKGFVAG